MLSLMDTFVSFIGLYLLFHIIKVSYSVNQLTVHFFFALNMCTVSAWMLEVCHTHSLN